MNALDLRADHPKLLSAYRPSIKHPLGRRFARALRRTPAPDTRVESAVAR